MWIMKSAESLDKPLWIFWLSRNVINFPEYSVAYLYIYFYDFFVNAVANLELLIPVYIQMHQAKDTSWQVVQLISMKHKHKYLLRNWKRAQLAAAFFLITSPMYNHFWVVSMHYLLLSSYSNISNSGRNSQGITRGARGHNSLGVESLGDPKVPTMPQVLSWIQYICFRNTSGSNTESPNLLLAPDAI